MSRLRGAGATKIAAVVCIVAAFAFARLPTISAELKEETAAEFALTALPVAELRGHGSQATREVNRTYEHIRAWISSVGAGIAMTNLDQDQADDDICYVDPRIDLAVVAPAPIDVSPYPAFALDPAPLAYDPQTMAPMGCLPGDFNEDGRTDLLVYFWGRTPIVYISTLKDAESPALSLYRPTELLPSAGPSASYSGPLWYTNAATQADFDGDAHVDLLLGNYFPDGSHVLGANSPDDVTMQHSMSRASNGGSTYFLRWTGNDPLTYDLTNATLPPEVAHGWTLAAGATDLDGDLLPEVYLANDFGPDHLLHNESTPGSLKFQQLTGRRHLWTPSSKVLGEDSFKGMGVDFGDLNSDGIPDMFVSNITVPYGLQESNFVWMSTGHPTAMKRQIAPFEDRSEPIGMSRSGWGWDTKLADLDNDGVLEALQATGFVKGSTDRWPELQELAMGNDELLQYPELWPRFADEDDLSGKGGVNLFARTPTGRYVEVGADAGFAGDLPTRGIALADTDGDGDIDMGVAQQWGPPLFYRNDCPDCGRSLELRLLRPTPDGAYLPAIGATASVVASRSLSGSAQVDGGNGHSGKRAPVLLFGLGEAGSAPLPVSLRWRDEHGILRSHNLQLSPASHTIVLDAEAALVHP